jgi:ribosomal protein S8
MMVGNNLDYSRLVERKRLTKNERESITNQVAWPGVEYLFDLIFSVTHHIVLCPPGTRKYTRKTHFPSVKNHLDILVVTSSSL